MDATVLYHEKQVAALCGVHCLNTLLQGPYFTEVDLAQIGHDLDAMERQFMQEGGVHTDEYNKFLQEASGNVANDGMFSIQVLSKALEVWNLEVIPLDNPEVRASREEPSRESAYICNLQEHWFAVRTVNTQWWNFNSLFPAPQPLSSFYLSAFFDTLRDQGYTIFLVRGDLPRPQQRPSGSSEGAGRWLTPEEAAKANEEADKARQQGRVANALENALARAQAGGGTINLRSRGAVGEGAGPQGDDEDPELAAAIAASLADADGWGAGPSTSGAAQQQQEQQQQGDAAWSPASQEAGGAGGGGPGSVVMEDAVYEDDDPELAAAIAASLEDMVREGGGGGASTSAQAEAAPTPTLQLEEPGPEPEDGPAVVTVAVRLPDGSRATRRFEEAASVRSLYGWAASQGADPASYVLCTSFPRQELAVESSSTLQEAGLTGRQMLTAEKRLSGSQQA